MLVISEAVTEENVVEQMMQYCCGCALCFFSALVFRY